MTEAVIQKWGNSQGIRLPKHILDALHLKTDETVTLDIRDGALVIRKAHTKKDIRELFANYTGTYSEKEVDFGASVGDEVW